MSNLLDELSTEGGEVKAPDLAWIAALLLLAIYEIYALSTNQITLSRAVWTTTRGQYGPLLPFLAGMIAGHFFWSGN